MGTKKIGNVDFFTGEFEKSLWKIFYRKAASYFYQMPLIFIILKIFPKVVVKYKHKANIIESNSVWLIWLY